MKNKLYVINGKTYLSHINDEVHLCGLLHQLAFLAGRIKDEEDVFHVLDTAKRYGEIAEEKFQSWGIPGRYLVCLLYTSGTGSGSRCYTGADLSGVNRGMEKAAML